jgi:hypothetical protein
MTVELVLQGASRETAQTVFNALDAYKVWLRASIHRTPPMVYRSLLTKGRIFFLVD